MAKLTVNPTPSAEVVAKAVAETSVTDALGRVITLKKPRILAQYQLIEILGDSAKNEVYWTMTFPLIFVVAIDGDAVSMPMNKREVEALISRLDDEGVSAVVHGVQEHFGQSNPEQDKEQLKN